MSHTDCTEGTDGSLFGYMFQTFSMTRGMFQAKSHMVTANSTKRSAIRCFPLYTDNSEAMATGRANAQWEVMM